MKMSSLTPVNRHTAMPSSNSTVSVSPALRPIVAPCCCPTLPSSSSRIASSSSSSSSSGAGGNSSGDCHALGGSTPCSWLPAAHSISTTATAAARRQHVVPQAGFGGFGANKAGKAGGSKSKDCPCGSGKLYSKCCEVFHKSAAAHPDPESLLRARYSAFVKKVPKFLRATSHKDNPALKGSSTTLPDGSVKQCSYEEDLAMTFLAAEFTGFELLSSSVTEDGASCSVDCRARFRRLIDSEGKRVGKPQEETWMERASLVRDDEGNWLVREVQAIEPAAAV